MLKVKPPGGYTILELLCVLNLIAIFTLMASAVVRASFIQIKTWQVTRQIINELNLARSLALANHQETIYGIDAVEGGTWDKNRVVIQQQQIKYRFSAIPSNFHLALHNSLNKNQRIIFTPLGFTLSERGSFYLQSPGHEVRLIVNVSGAVRMQIL